jgi:hypothetical protein
MPVKSPDGQGVLGIKDHEALSRSLLLARARLSQVSSQVRAGCPWRQLRPLMQSLEASPRQVNTSCRSAGVNRKCSTSSSCVYEVLKWG